MELSHGVGVGRRRNLGLLLGCSLKRPFPAHAWATGFRAEVSASACAPRIASSTLPSSLSGSRKPVPCSRCGGSSSPALPKTCCLSRSRSPGRACAVVGGAVALNPQQEPPTPRRIPDRQVYEETRPSPPDAQPRKPLALSSVATASSNGESASRPVTRGMSMFPVLAYSRKRP